MLNEQWRSTLRCLFFPRFHLQVTLCPPSWTVKPDYIFSAGMRSMSSPCLMPTAKVMYTSSCGLQAKGYCMLIYHEDISLPMIHFDLRWNLITEAISTFGVFSFCAVGILYGTMTLELGGKITIECEKTKCAAELEFKLKVQLLI